MLNLKRRSLPIKSLVVGSTVGAFALACASVYGQDSADKDSFDLRVHVGEVVELVGSVFTNNIRQPTKAQIEQHTPVQLGLMGTDGTMTGSTTRCKVNIESTGGFKLVDTRPGGSQQEVNYTLSYENNTSVAGRDSFDVTLSPCVSHPSNESEVIFQAVSLSPANLGTKMTNGIYTGTVIVTVTPQ